MRQFKVMASSMIATYSAGIFTAKSKADAIEMAREEYRTSALGRQLKDVGSFRFYTVDIEESEE